VPSHYLNPLAALGDERPVVFYDQLGAGRSDRVTDTTLFRIERFVAELDALRSSLGLREVHLLGHSWGSMLAIDYLLGGAAGVRSVILASPLASAARWQHDADSLLGFLPDSVRALLARHETAGTTQSPEYQAGMMEYYTRFVFRRQPTSPDLDSAMAGMGTAVYGYMWGPSEFRATGTLRHYERVDRLAELRLPVLFTAGEFDEATPAAVASYRSALPGSRLEIIPGSAHLTMHDAPEAFLQVVRAFLREVEAGGR
jgi:proline iminopeptidase